MLLLGSQSEQDAPPNLMLRPAAIDLINTVRGRVHERCGRVVSCVDITALLARDSVKLSGGPKYPVPLGRRDGTSFATHEVTLASLPPPSSNTQKLIEAVEKLNLDVKDLVTLSGAHTIGIGALPDTRQHVEPVLRQQSQARLPFCQRRQHHRA